MDWWKIVALIVISLSSFGDGNPHRNCRQVNFTVYETKQERECSTLHKDLCGKECSSVTNQKVNITENDKGHKDASGSHKVEVTKKDKDDKEEYDYVTTDFKDEKNEGYRQPRCKEERREKCHTVEDRACKETAMETRCRTVQQRHCKPVQTEKCTTRKTLECHTEFVESCNDKKLPYGYYGGFKRKCEASPRRKCEQVPEENCEKVENLECEYSPKEECWEVPKIECEVTPREVCREVVETKCYGHHGGYQQDQKDRGDYQESAGVHGDLGGHETRNKQTRRGGHQKEEKKSQRRPQRRKKPWWRGRKRKRRNAECQKKDGVCKKVAVEECSLKSKKVPKIISMTVCN